MNHERKKDNEYITMRMICLISDDRRGKRNGFDIFDSQESAETLQFVQYIIQFIKKKEVEDVWRECSP